MHTKSKIKIGMVQINNSFLNQTYFPYSLGLLQAYSQKHLKNIDDFEFLLPIYKRIPLENAVRALLGSDIIFFSTYIWNFKISSEIAKRIKENKPNTLIVFGGCQVPGQGIENFLRNSPFVNIACHGEGEKVFNAILENYKTGDWENVPSISYLDRHNKIVNNPKTERISNLDETPSPYLTGVFDALMRANPQEEWLGLWETNRGCPFGCSYCEWGGDYQKRLYTHGLKKLFEEIDWFSRNKIEFIFCCDSNFGILDRDLEIVNRVAENKKKYGYPKALSVQNTKNSTDKSYNIQKVLAKAGLSKGVNLAFQSLNEETLKSVGRKNISTKTFYELQQKFCLEGIETFSDLILGLPDETYDTFTEGISQLIENGQHNRIQFNNLSILPNSEMANPEYQKKYGLIIQETKIINIHGSLAEADGIYETQELVVGTNTMPKTDWVKTRAFSWMVALLYFDKILQIPLIILHKICSVSFKELIEIFTKSETSSPMISKIRSFFINKAIEIQNGEVEYCQSKKWLNIWWPPDELMLIKLCTENKLDAFYKEARQEIKHFLRERNLSFPSYLLDGSIYLNRNLMKLPLQYRDSHIQLSHNIFEVYQATLKGMSVPIKKGIYNYYIDHKSKNWSSWEDWCREVIWYENKKGAYLYTCHAASNNT